jgi:hypothetical protein
LLVIGADAEGGADAKGGGEAAGGSAVWETGPWAKAAPARPKLEAIRRRGVRRMSDDL